MNERIQELAGKALDKAVPYTWTRLDYDQIQELLAYHTELIVRECAQVSEDDITDGDACCTNTADRIARQIKKHFGVE